MRKALEVLKNLFFSIIVAVIALIPVWVFCGLWWWLEPSTVLEKLATIAVCGIILGGIQIWMAIGGVAFIVAIWMESR